MQTKKIVNAIQRLTRLEKPLKLRNYRQSIKKVPLKQIANIKKAPIKKSFS